MVAVMGTMRVSNVFVLKLMLEGVYTITPELAPPETIVVATGCRAVVRLGV